LVNLWGMMRRSPLRASRSGARDVRLIRYHNSLCPDREDRVPRGDTSSLAGKRVDVGDDGIRRREGGLLFSCDDLHGLENHELAAPRENRWGRGQCRTSNAAPWSCPGRRLRIECTRIPPEVSFHTGEQFSGRCARPGRTVWK
jgi:hypothetical protein